MCASSKSLDCKTQQCRCGLPRNGYRATVALTVPPVTLELTHTFAPVNRKLHDLTEGLDKLRRSWQTPIGVGAKEHAAERPSRRFDSEMRRTEVGGRHCSYHGGLRKIGERVKCFLVLCGEELATSG